MTQRLPIPGQDSGDWGDILNSFLEVSLASDGTINSGVVGSSQLSTSSVTSSAIASNAVGTNQLANNSVTNAQLDVPTQTTLATVASKYTKPSSGIPASDLTTAVQTNLTSASTSVQPSTTLTGDLSGTIASPVVAKINGVAMPSGAPNTGQVIQATSTNATNWATISSTTVSDATSGAKGIIQLDGDLGGTAASPTVTTIGGHTPVTTVTTLTGGDLTGTLPSPTVAKVNGVAVTGTPSNGQVITASSGTAAAWTTPSAGAGNATSSSLGIIQLDGDLSGTAASPSVTSIKGITLPSSAPSTGNVLTATSSSATTWSTPAAGVTLDSTSTDIQPDTTTGTAVAGSSSMAAKADHQHTLVSHDHSTSNKGGQLTATTGLNATGTASSTTYLRGDNTWTAAPTAANATSSTPGLIQLSGSLGGTAAAPTVVTNANLTGDVTSVGNATTLTSSSNVESVISANTTVAGALQKTNNLSDIADAGTSRANIHVPALTPAACVVTTNVATLSGLNTYDGYTLAAGDIVLLTGQTSAIQNGLYTAASGSWTRPTEMATGVVMKARTVAIIQGTNYGGSIFLLRTNTSLTVDTSSQTWVQQLPSSVVNAAGATASYVPVASGNGNYAWQILSSGSGGSNSTSNLGSLGATKTFPSVSAGATVFMYGILTANTTITLPTANAGAAITLELTQNSNGGWVPSFGGVTVTYPLGTPNWLTETNAVNVLELRCFDGSTWQIIPVSSEVAEGTFTYLRVNGITGANTDPMFFAGMTASGAPSSGTFPANTFAFDETGAIFFTATGGSPGTWIQVNSSGGSGSSNVIDGVTISGTPSSGQSIVATSSSAATWQTPSGGSTTVSRASASTALPGNDADSLWLPRYNGFLTWTLPIYVANTTVGTGTNTYLMKTYIPRNMTVNNITLIVTSAGASLTANSCYAGIYNSAGMLIGQTTDQSSSWTSLGTKTMALTSPVSLTGGDDDFVWIAICAAGTTLPSFAGPVNGTTYLNVNVSAANSFGAYITNGMPASFTPSSVTQSTTFRWAALS